MLNFNIDPVLFRIFGLEIRYYGLVYGLGIILIYLYLRKKSELNPERLEKLMLFMLLGMFFGARITSLVQNGILDPLEIFRIWNGGMSFYGGFIGGFIGCYYVLRKNVLKIGDLIVIPLSFILILGRFANFLNKELIGKVSNAKWCFVINNECRHPYVLYALIGHVILFFILYYLSKRNHKEGVIFFSFILGYGVLRFITEFFRDNFKILGLSGWQYFSIIFILIGIYGLIRKNRLLKSS